MLNTRLDGYINKQSCLAVSSLITDNGLQPVSKSTVTSMSFTNMLSLAEISSEIESIS